MTRKERANGTLGGRQISSEHIETTLENRDCSRIPLTYTKSKCMPKFRTWQENGHLIRGHIKYKYLSWYLPNEPNRTRYYERCSGRTPNIILIDPGGRDMGQEFGLARSELLQLA